MTRVLIPIPSQDFDPTEAAVPWKTRRALGISVVFAARSRDAGGRASA